MRNFTFVATAAVLLVAAALVVDVDANQQFRGMLVDRLSVNAITTADGVNMITSPQLHKAMRALDAASVASGFTILTKPAAGQTTYGPMYNLTVASNRKAYAFLRSLYFADANRANLDVSVVGVLTGAGELDIQTNIINDRGLTAPRFFEGYLADRECLDRVFGLDRANMMERPQDHSLHCMLISVCVQSGFSIHLPKNTSEPGYGAVYNFTASSHQTVEAWLRTLNYHRKDLKARLYGQVNDAGLLELLATPGSTNVTMQDLGDGSAASRSFNVFAAFLAVILATAMIF